MLDKVELKSIHDTQRLWMIENNLLSFSVVRGWFCVYATSHFQSATFLIWILLDFTAFMFFYYIKCKFTSRISYSTIDLILRIMVISFKLQLSQSFFWSNCFLLVVVVRRYDFCMFLLTWWAKVTYLFHVEDVMMTVKHWLCSCLTVYFIDYRSTLSGDYSHFLYDFFQTLY